MVLMQRINVATEHFSLEMLSFYKKCEFYKSTRIFFPAIGSITRRNKRSSFSYRGGRFRIAYYDFPGGSTCACAAPFSCDEAFPGQVPAVGSRARCACAEIWARGRDRDHLGRFPLPRTAAVAVSSGDSGPGLAACGGRCP